MKENVRKAGWLYRYKRKIIVGILLALTLSIAATMVFIAITLRTRLIDDSKVKTHELSEVIRLSLSHLMLVRNPGSIQNTLEAITTGESSIVKAFILDKNGTVAYSSARSDIRTRIDRFSDRSCSGCHTGPVTVPHETTMLVSVDGREVLRNVSIIYNEKPCYTCHASSDRINGKLIIDRSVQPTYDLVAGVELMLAASGLICLVILVPFLSRILSRGLDKYIEEIIHKSTELSMLYTVVERLSKSIEIEELKHIVVDIIRELFVADEVRIVLPKDKKELGSITWKRVDNRTDHRMPPNEDPHQEGVQTWMQGELSREKISANGNTVYIPIAKGGARLALIIATRSDRSFDLRDLGLIRAMGSHIAVAFENAALYHLAITDELTTLYSKRHFRSIIEKKFLLYEQFGEKMTLLLLDIDDFKKVNDTHGHPAGDIVLRDVARRILSTTREGDIDFRYGGEEFSVILPATDRAGGIYVSERIRERIDGDLFKVGDQELRITVSIGVASMPQHAKTIRDLVSEADKALYEAKRMGKNRVVVSKKVSD